MIQPTPEEALAIARRVLDGLRLTGGTPEAIAFWERAVVECEADLAQAAEPE